MGVRKSLKLGDPVPKFAHPRSSSSSTDAKDDDESTHDVELAFRPPGPKAESAVSVKSPALLPNVKTSSKPNVLTL